MTSIREELNRKLNNLSPEQLDLVRQFVESLDIQATPQISDYPLMSDTGLSVQALGENSSVRFSSGNKFQRLALTNEDIDRIVESYRQQNKLLPIGLAKGEFTVPDDFNESLPDEILDLFNHPA